MTVQLLSEELRPVLDGSEDVACVLDADLRFVYCNPAWDRFARANQGEMARGERILGSGLLDVVADPLRRFYQHAFEAVGNSGNPFEFDYECSSADSFRLFRMHIRPLNSGGGFLVFHSLRVEEPYDRSAVLPDPGRYCTPDGLIVMCAHCRRTRRAQQPDIWDWVPAHLNDRSLQVSHGLCGICRAYLHPDVG